MAKTPINLKSAFLKGDLRQDLSKLCFKDGLMRMVLRGQLPAYGPVKLSFNSKGRIVGWAVVTKTKGDFGLNPIIMVYVDRHYRGRGIAKQLLKAMTQDFRKLYQIPSPQTIYNIPRSQKNVVYFDRVTKLFAKVIKKSGFRPRKY